MTPVSRRESEILDCVYKLGTPTAKAVQLELDDGASYSTIRTVLRKLVEKGWLTRKEDGPRYLYVPKIKHQRAANTAIDKLLGTFFENSPMLAVNTLLNYKSENFSEEEITQLEKLLAKKRNQLDAGEKNE